ncbi:hypothetical protein RJT34_03187 [Clitoria ternatea]|uniref:Protein BOLA2 n=1 Tax=Clitoria ternatea TaxID=43366 RepID=A0AAN9PZL1_CLITE
MFERCAVSTNDNRIVVIFRVDSLIFFFHVLFSVSTDFKERRKKEKQVRAMGVTKEQVESSLNTKLNPSHIEVVDTSGGCGASFVVEIVSAQFEGKRLLDRHRMVNAALEEEMKQIHALSVKKALTPEQWKQHQESNQSNSTA